MATIVILSNVVFMCFSIVPICAKQNKYHYMCCKKVGSLTNDEIEQVMAMTFQVEAYFLILNNCLASTTKELPFL
jgi:hypothetical protein